MKAPQLSFLSLISSLNFALTATYTEYGVIFFLFLLATSSFNWLNCGFNWSVSVQHLLSLKLKLKFAFATTVLFNINFTTHHTEWSGDFQYLFFFSFDFHRMSKLRQLNLYTNLSTVFIIGCINWTIINAICLWLCVYVM